MSVTVILMLGGYPVGDQDESWLGADSNRDGQALDLLVHAAVVSLASFQVGIVTQSRDSLCVCALPTCLSSTRQFLVCLSHSPPEQQCVVYL